jgi:hypothetical protein
MQIKKKQTTKDTKDHREKFPPLPPCFKGFGFSFVFLQVRVDPRSSAIELLCSQARASSPHHAKAARVGVPGLRSTSNFKTKGAAHRNAF